ncbi:MAG: hypothetical protein EOP20_12335 [Hyphomicrobiales bacterium]|nr:MAG: hypothetical protein EOP20_12335 [Hyphomicrobiales bacterium]
MSTYNSPAVRRYTIRLTVLMSLYILLIFATGWTFRHSDVAGLPAYALAIAPALPIIGAFWAVMRLLVEESDEYIRMLHVRQCLFATGFCLTVTTVWQFLQNYDLVPAGNGGFGAAFFWFVGLGLGAVYNRVTMGVIGSKA